MADLAILVRNLSKQYTIGVAQSRHDTIRDWLAYGARGVFRRNGKANRETNSFWALKNVSFEIECGEVVGVIGRNGAGKSTLLKILSRITEPTSGYAEIHGRVGSLLEVGTGFHQELSGRENIYLNGAILGMKKEEIERKFDEIVAFAEVEKFIDTPVKHYSSGMYLRLAFAVAAHLEPDILLVDEVLAVGDAAFQKKCLGKMGDVAKEGRTVLFVSHNMAAIDYLCDKGIVLENGRVAFSGEATKAIEYYAHSQSENEANSNCHNIDLKDAPGRPSKYPPLLRRLQLFTDDGIPVKGSLKIGAHLKAAIWFRLDRATSSFDACLGFNNLLDQRVFTAHSMFQPNLPRQEKVGEQVFVCEIPALTLTPGEYKIRVTLAIGNTEVDAIDDAVRITIRKSDYYGTGKAPWNGYFVLNHSWHLQ